MKCQNNLKATLTPLTKFSSASHATPTPITRIAKITTAAYKTNNFKKVSVYNLNRSLTPTPHKIPQASDSWHHILLETRHGRRVR